MNIKERIDYLVNLINEANYNYHVLDNPTIEDQEYDKYLRELYTLEEKYPDLDRKEREHAIAKEYKALFLYQIGWPLKDGKSHDGRAADYDDWNLNGDILLWYEPLGISLEISSMGIRVNKESLVKQLEAKGENYKLESPYVKNILNVVLPLTIGGGIGQSRMCMYMLKKAHIGEVQSSVWSKEDIELFAKHNIHLL